MSRAVRTKSEMTTPVRAQRPQSATELPVDPEPSISDKLRRANDAITNEVFKQLTSRINNQEEEEEDEALRKRITCNYCLIKSKYNINGKCLEHSVPMMQSRNNTKKGMGLFKQVEVKCNGQNRQAKSAAKQPIPVSKEELINELLGKLDELIPQIQNEEEVNHPLCQEVMLQLERLLGKQGTQIESKMVVPFTPITKPKTSKFRELPSETPIKANDLSKSQAKEQLVQSPRFNNGSIYQNVKKWTDYFYSILEHKAMGERPQPIKEELLATYVEVMEIKFLGYVTRLQQYKRHIDELNSKLIGYIEMASDNISEKQIEDDLALVEKSSSLAEQFGRSVEVIRQQPPTRPMLSCPDELVRLLLVQANSVQGMILELQQQNSIDEPFLP